MKATCTHQQAILTRYLGPTNSRGGRIVARAQAGRIVVAWDHELGIAENHEKACRAFARKWDWNSHFVGGALPDGSYAWVAK